MHLNTFGGCLGECISHEVKSGQAYGTLLVLLEYVIFVLISLAGGFKRPENTSVCGYLELLPNWVGLFYFHVAASGIDSTVWHAVMTVKKEPHTLFAAIQMISGVACAGALLGFSVFPRCLWSWHQSCVLLWVYATSFAMILMLFRDHRKEKYTAIPLIVWLLGAFLCNLFYYESSFRFYAAEGLTILAYIMWCSSLQHLHGRKFKMTYVLVVNGLEAVLIMQLFRYNQHYICKESGKW
jgi:hypothetical protein